MINIRTIVIVLVIIILTSILVLGPSSKKKELVNQSTCIIKADYLHTVKYNNIIYRRIRVDAPIFYAGIYFHLVPTSPARLFLDDKYYSSFIPWFEGNTDKKYLNWRPDTGVENLLFVDKTDEQSVIDPGFRYFDIYLKQNKDKNYVVPAFIQQYCAQNYPVNKKTIRPDQNGNFSPPLFFNSTDPTTNIAWQNGSSGDPKIDQARPIPGSKYYLLSYEHKDSLSGKLSIDGKYPSGNLTINGKGNTKIYKAYFVHSIFDYIALLDQDTNSADSNFVYRYTAPTSDFIPIEYPYVTPQSVQRQNLQIDTFYYPGVNAWGWWSPECKPAIYLYPEKEMEMKVIVSPVGRLTYSEPIYPSGGWKIKVDKNGSIIYRGKKYPYLYYESQILNSAIKKPDQGYVVEYERMPEFFSTLLPKLGLNNKEIIDFKSYWEKVLPNQPYYIVRIMDKEAIDKIEPLTISPKEDTIIRVRLYFESVKEKVEIKEPDIKPVFRKGFTVVEWGGLVKTDQEHPFTCSQ